MGMRYNMCRNLNNYFYFMINNTRYVAKKYQLEKKLKYCLLYNSIIVDDFFSLLPNLKLDDIQ